MNSEDPTSENHTETLPENPVVDPHDYSPPPPASIAGDDTRLAERKTKRRSTMGKVLPIAAAGVALAAAGAVAYAKSRHESESSAEEEDPAPELPLDINKASKEDLMYLPHIGPAFADKIIKARPFKAVEDLLSVQGIGEQYLEDIAPHLKV